MFGVRTVSTKGYALLNNDEVLSEKVSKHQASVRTSLLQWIVWVLVISCVGSLGFLVGRRSTLELNGLQLNSYSTVFTYDPNFGEVTRDADKAWDDIFPAEGGFIKHPALARETSAFAVFHQLHCLNGIRRGYWTLYQAMNESRLISDHDIPRMSGASHVRHCIELLRLALMCQPDLTLEVKDEVNGGVQGFGTEHQCKNWEQLMEFTEEWEPQS